jgi:hypothetical protein
MSEPKYDLAEASLLLGREATRHGDWSSEQHGAAAALLRELATLDQLGIKSVAVTAQIGTHLSDPHSLRIEFVGGDRIAVTYDRGKFVASDPAGQRPPLEIDLQYNAFLGMFESFENDPTHHGVRRSAATQIVKKAFQHLHERT